jgi:hypothetical protein
MPLLAASEALTLQSALLAAIGTLTSVVVVLAGALVYLWKELRAQYRKHARDSALYLTTLEQLRKNYSERVPAPERRTPTDSPHLDPHTLAGFYSRHSRKNPTLR